MASLDKSGVLPSYSCSPKLAACGGMNSKELFKHPSANSINRPLASLPKKPAMRISPLSRGYLVGAHGRAPLQDNPSPLTSGSIGPLPVCLDDVYQVVNSFLRGHGLLDAL